MAVVLGPDRYGKAESRLVRVPGDGEVHQLKDLNVGIALSGDEVFHADDRPYGLIGASVLADDAPPPGPAWDPYPLL